MPNGSLPFTVGLVLIAISRMLKIHFHATGVTAGSFKSRNSILSLYPMAVVSIARRSAIRIVSTMCAMCFAIQVPAHLATSMYRLVAIAVNRNSEFHATLLNEQILAACSHA